MSCFEPQNALLFEISSFFGLPKAIIAPNEPERVLKNLESVSQSENIKHPSIRLNYEIVALLYVQYHEDPPINGLHTCLYKWVWLCEGSLACSSITKWPKLASEENIHVGQRWDTTIVPGQHTRVELGSTFQKIYEILYLKKSKLGRCEHSA